jgi:WD40 repeat protein
MRCPNCNYQGLPPDTKYCIKCGAHLLSLQQHALPPRTRLRGNTYEIDSVLGKGGFGITYKAHHTVLEQAVAIKEYYPEQLAHRDSANGTLTVPPDKQDIFQSWLQRFMREGRILARLNHPSLVKVRDLFKERGTAYLVMELVPGKTLKEELEAAQKFPPEQVREMMASLVDALEIVHQEKVYHLDIKPDNVLLTPEGGVVLIDFGSAKPVSVTPVSKKTALAITPDYAPLELINNQEFGPESDIFELGMMLHELLTGTLPEPALGRMSGVTWEPNLAEPWQSLVKAALVLDKDQRSNNIRQWWGAPAKAPVSIQQPGNPQTATKIVGVSCVLELGGDRFRLSPDRKTLAGGAGWSNGVSLWDVATGKQLQAFSCTPSFLAYTSDGKCLVVGNCSLSSCSVKLWDVATGKKLQTWSLSSSDSNSNLTFSPDGKYLASCSGNNGNNILRASVYKSDNNTVPLWDVATGKQLYQLIGAKDSVGSVIFSPNSQILAGWTSSTVLLWDVATGRVLHELNQDNESVSSVIFSPDSQVLASWSSSNLYLWDIATGKQLHKLTQDKKSVSSVAISPDNQILVSWSSGALYLWDVATGKQLHELTQDNKYVSSVIFSPDSKILAYGYHNKTHKTLYLWDIAAGKQLHELTGNSVDVTCVAFSPDGQTLAAQSSDPTVRLWDVATGKPLRPMIAHSGTVNTVEFSPDGKYLVSAGNNVVRLWEIYRSH